MKRVPFSQHHPGVASTLILVAALAGALSTNAAADAERSVTVRTFNYAQVPAEQLASARLNATIIFSRAGISLHWIDCRVPQSESGAACTEPLGERGDLMLRLVDSPPQTSERIVALGTSLLDLEQRAGVLMTVDAVPIRVIAEKTSTDVSILLGRAIAHEIGHLLLGSSSHPGAGLMRALWTHEELRGLKPAYWQFTAHEAAQMRHGLSVKGPNAN
jgi:hypothetical protein